MAVVPSAKTLHILEDGGSGVRCVFPCSHCQTFGGLFELCGGKLPSQDTITFGSGFGFELSWDVVCLIALRTLWVPDKHIKGEFYLQLGLLTGERCLCLLGEPADG